MEKSNNLTPFLQLRQDDVVTVSLERYDQLIAAETRLNILIRQRSFELTNDRTPYVRADDHIMGDEVMNAHWLHSCKKEQEAKDE